uniref:Integrase catalytic domain-containing protein n=1 Tax=Strongyloides stercoralis TaxID=6248 RepID=A0A0K0EAY1_STRER
MVVHQVGAFKQLQFDNQTCFTSDETKSYLDSIGTVYSYSIPYQHESNGGAERLIRSIKSSLGRFFDLKESKSQSMYKTLMRLRQIPYPPRKGIFTKKKTPTPLQLLFNDETREYSHPILFHINNLITPILHRGYFKRRPDLNSELELCTVLSRRKEASIHLPGYRQDEIDIYVGIHYLYNTNAPYKNAVEAVITYEKALECNNTEYVNSKKFSYSFSLGTVYRELLLRFGMEKLDHFGKFALMEKLLKIIRDFTKCMLSPLTRQKMWSNMRCHMDRFLENRRKSPKPKEKNFGRKKGDETNITIEKPGDTTISIEKAGDTTISIEKVGNTTISTENAGNTTIDNQGTQ